MWEVLVLINLRLDFKYMSLSYFDVFLTVQHSIDFFKLPT